MFWVAVHGFDNGQAISLGTIEEYEAEVLGLHGYPTAAEAEAKPNALNNLNYLQVEAWFANAEKISLGKALGTGAKKAAAAAGGALPSAFSLVFGNTTGLLGRIVKVALGSLLIIAGVFRISGGKDVLQIAARGAFA